jgi:hypothetical protein
VGLIGTGSWAEDFICLCSLRTKDAVLAAICGRTIVVLASLRTSTACHKCSPSNPWTHFNEQD